MFEKIIKFFKTPERPLPDYVVDTTKNPIYPPARVCSYGGSFETEWSKKNTQKWKKYIQEYHTAMEEENKRHRL